MSSLTSLNTTATALSSIPDPATELYAFPTGRILLLTLLITIGLPLDLPTLLLASWLFIPSMIVYEAYHLYHFDGSPLETVEIMAAVGVVAMYEWVCGLLEQLHESAEVLRALLRGRQEQERRRLMEERRRLEEARRALQELQRMLEDEPRRREEARRTPEELRRRLEGEVGVERVG